MKVTQDQHGSVVLVDIHERDLDVMTEVGPEKEPLGIGSIRGPLPFEGFLPRAPLDVIERFVEGDPIEPTEELVLGIETRQLPVSLEESVLGEVGSFVAIVDHPQDGVVNRSLIPVNQKLKACSSPPRHP